MFIFDKRRPSLRRENQEQIKSQIKIKNEAGFARQPKGPGGEANPQTRRQLGDYRRRQGPLRSRPHPFLLAPMKLGAARAAASGRALDSA